MKTFLGKTKDEFSKDELWKELENSHKNLMYMSKQNDDLHIELMFKREQTCFERFESWLSEKAMKWL